MSQIKALVSIAKGSLDEFLTDNCQYLAAAISYYVLFSFFPLAVAALSLAGFVLRSPEIEARVLESIGELLPVSGELIASTIRSVVQARGVTGFLATVGLIWAGTAVFAAVRKSLNTAWGIREPRPFVRDRLVELGMMLVAGLLVLLSMSLIIALQAARDLSLSVFEGTSDLFWNLITSGLVTAVAFSLFLFLYWFVPKAPIRLADVWIGALGAAIAFEASSVAFVWYTARFATYHLIYGPLSAVIVFLVWNYISAIILLMGAKLSHVLARRRGLWLGHTNVIH
jgi:membrane protein